MSAHGIFKLGRVSIMLQIWHLAIMPLLLPVSVGVVEILVLTRSGLRFGGCLCVSRVVLLKKCLATDMLLYSFHGDNVRWCVCSRRRQLFDACCYCAKSSDSIICSQFLSYNEICTRNTYFIEHSNELTTHLLPKLAFIKVILKQWSKVTKIPRTELL